MKNLLDKATIIKLKQEWLSNRGVARTLGIDKKTVNKYWNEYKENIQKLNETTNIVEISEIQENITSAPKYNSENRNRRKVTPEFLNALEKILEDEEKKVKILGTNKQALTKQQIFELLKKTRFYFKLFYCCIRDETNYKFRKWMFYQTRLWLRR